ncbi:MAG: hypothetical protein ACI8W8_001157 [Rhodothermales bacterium]|jgi:hypothetical protein
MALSRRSLLRAAGVALPLPLLDAMAQGAKVPPAKRLLIIHSFLGFHGPEFIPKQAGTLTKLGRVIEPLAPFKDKFSILSGLQHQEAGHGHAGVIAFTTGRHPGRHGGRKSISADQRVAEVIGADTRHDSLSLQAGSGNAQGLSWSRSGGRRSPIADPAATFDRLFTQKLAGSHKRQLSLAASILDSTLDETKRLNLRLGPGDRMKLDEYQTSLRELEIRTKKQQTWLTRPVAVPKGERPEKSKGGIISLLPNFADLIALAFETDSTRVITLDLPGTNRVFSMLPGVSGGHHGLSHHGKSSTSIEQLITVEREIMSNVSKLLKRLESTQCTDGSTLLDNTIVVVGSGLGNASSHSTKNLPILVAGGSFQHGKHHAFNRGTEDTPFCNLYLSIFRQLGIDDPEFGDSTGELTGFA